MSGFFYVYGLYCMNGKWMFNFFLVIKTEVRYKLYRTTRFWKQMFLLLLKGIPFKDFKEIVKYFLCYNWNCKFKEDIALQHSALPRSNCRDNLSKMKGQLCYMNFLSLKNALMDIPWIILGFLGLSFFNINQLLICIHIFRKNKVHTCIKEHHITCVVADIYKSKQTIRYDRVVSFFSIIIIQLKFRLWKYTKLINLIIQTV